MNPALYQLLEAYYKKRRLALIVTIAICSVVAVIGIGLLVASLVDGPSCSRRLLYYSACVDRYYREATWRTVVLSVFPGITAIICGFFLYPLRDLSQAPIIRIFTARKDDVAWIYAKRTSVRKYGVEVNQIHEVVVCTTDGKRLLLTMTEEDVKKSIRLMADEAPRAAVGFDDRVEAQFARNPASVQQAIAAPTMRAATAPSARMVIAPDCPFARIDQGIRYLGFTPEAAQPAPMPVPGEVAYAVWSGKGMRIAYSFDPMLYLRVLEITGGDPMQLRNELSGVVSVPVLGPQQIAGMLASYDPRSILLGLRAAEAGGTPAERGMYQDIVGRLQAHPDPNIAQAAQRVVRGWA